MQQVAFKPLVALRSYMIESKGNNSLTAISKVRTHAVVAGVLPALGGQDEGMNPHEILESALASCTIITLEMYAKRKNYPLSAVEVKVKVASEGSESVIEREIKLTGTLNEEERIKLLEIANKCPIHKLLQSQVTIQTKASTN